MSRVLRVGLTGGIGSGKSTVAQRLVQRGAVLIDADVLAREVVAPGSEGLAAVVEHFGPGILDADGALDRPAMARRVFGDDEARNELNAIVHPRVRARTGELMAQAPADAVIIHDVPLLVEAGYQPGYHLVVVVDAPVDERVRRLVARGLDEADARARIQAQATDEQRRAAADVWLDNSGPVEAVHREVDRLWEERLLPFEHNVRLRRRPPQRPPHVVAYDPEWPRAAERLIARLNLTAGDRALRVDHIGSTSVPGLVAEDVIDLQIAVRSSADADELAEPLAEAGFPVIPGLQQETVHSVAPNPGEWQKRVHVSADPGRYADIHVRVADSAGWRFGLLLRDWLRAEPDVRREYADAKHSAAKQHARDHDSYTAAKESWFAWAVPRAEEWATRTGWLPPTVD